MSSPVVKRNIFQQPDLALNLGLRVRVGRQVEWPEAVVDHPGHDALEVTLHPAQGRVPAAPNLAAAIIKLFSPMFIETLGHGILKGEVSLYH